MASGMHLSRLKVMAGFRASTDSKRHRPRPRPKSCRRPDGYRNLRHWPGNFNFGKDSPLSLLLLRGVKGLFLTLTLTLSLGEPPALQRAPRSRYAVFWRWLGCGSLFTPPINLSLSLSLSLSLCHTLFASEISEDAVVSSAFCRQSLFSFRFWLFSGAPGSWRRCARRCASDVRRGPRAWRLQSVVLRLGTSKFWGEVKVPIQVWALDFLGLRAQGVTALCRMQSRCCFSSEATIEQQSSFCNNARACALAYPESECSPFRLLGAASFAFLACGTCVALRVLIFCLSFYPSPTDSLPSFFSSFPSSVLHYMDSFLLISLLSSNALLHSPPSACLPSMLRKSVFWLFSRSTWLAGL